MDKLYVAFLIVIILHLSISCGIENEINSPDIFFDFNGSIECKGCEHKGNEHNYSKGISNQALTFNPDSKRKTLELDSTLLDETKDFTIQFWIKTISELPTVFLSKKDFKNKGIIAQKNAGWAFYSSNGAFGWTIGSGDRRINYERDNGDKFPINDGIWHLLTMTYDKELSEVRLYYDGQNRAIYKVNFDFTNRLPLKIGNSEISINQENAYSADIQKGQENLQKLVDEFNTLGIETLNDDEFIPLIVDPESVYESKSNEKGQAVKKNLSNVEEIRRNLGENPYTVFQNMKLTVLKPVSSIYSLNNGKVLINDSTGKSFTEQERLFNSDFSIDNLQIWNKTLSSEDILNSFNKYRKTIPFKLDNNLKELNVGVWNIWHGGIHWSMEKDGWDSRMRIVEMIIEKDLDIILMQETYSNGDFIAAELGYYFATTSDWDYKYQGSNISVISRFPIKDLEVFEETEFNNVAVKLSISETQEIWAMSNWYGMNNFSKVFSFHKSRFDNSDKIPVLFGGDFNAVPHTDGGDSPASKALIDEGFIDAYRSTHQNASEYPGFTHQGNVRIDQLYYKGTDLENEFTEVISSWPKGFPSDHYLIVSNFKLGYQ